MAPRLDSKLPDVGTTIFTRMSALAAQHGAINLSQGFPEFDGPAYLRTRVCEYLEQGKNQYAPMTGVPSLREAIAEKIVATYQRRVCPEREVTVTSGATEALFAAIHAVVRPGDEVLVLDPSYDSYDPAIRLAGGRPRHLPLILPGYGIDWEALEAAVTPATRLIMLNTPHNPTGTILPQAELEHLWSAVKDHEVFIVGDEVYEHIIFDGAPHASLHRHPGLAERSFIVSSFGKTYHTTGWKVGYCVAPAPLSAELRKVHQFVTFCTVTPIQLALADMLRAHPEHHEQLGAFYQHKRDLFRAALAKSKLTLLPCQGTYFQLVDYGAVSAADDLAFCEWLTAEVKVAAIPVSVFYERPPLGRIVRLCFAKNDDTLAEAARRLGEL